MQSLKITTSKFLAVDTETTGLSLKHGCRAFALSACNQDGKTFYFETPVNVKDRSVKWPKKTLAEITRLLKSYKILVMHNAVFDMKALCYLSPTLAKTINSSYWKIHDTQILAHIFDSKGPRALKELAILHCDIDDSDEHELDSIVKKLHYKAKRLNWDYARRDHPHFPGAKSKFHKMDMWLPKAYANSEHYDPKVADKQFLNSVCETYAVQDAVRTMALFLELAPQVNQDIESLYPYNLQLDILRPTLAMEEAGLHIKTRYFKKIVRQYEEGVSEFTSQMQEMCESQDFNPESTPQLQEVLFDHFKFEPEKFTKSGNPSTDKEALPLLEYQPNTFQAKRFVKTLLKFRAMNSALKYLHSYDRFQKDFVIYPNINVTGTSTTRLSSSEPNGQNVSKGKETDKLDENGNKIIAYSLRKVFGPPPGKKWYAIDYDQLQIRIFAFLSKEQKLIDAILGGFDFHTTVAQGLYGVETPTKAQRKVAKYINFGIIFGAGKARISQLSGDPTAFSRFTKLYPNVAEYIAEKSSLAKQQGFIRTASGYPLSVPRNKPYVAVNYEVQGTEGDIVKLAFKNVFNFLQKKHPTCRILLQVHDEFIFECDYDYDFPYPKICKLMETCGVAFGVRCRAKPELIINNWAEGKEIDLKNEAKNERDLQVAC